MITYLQQLLERDAPCEPHPGRTVHSRISIVKFMHCDIAFDVTIASNTIRLHGESTRLLGSFDQGVGCL